MFDGENLSVKMLRAQFKVAAGPLALFVVLLMPAFFSPVSADAEETQAVALASPGSKAAPLVLGVFPRRGARATHKLFQPLADHLQAALGRQVKLETSRDFKTFWRGIEERRYDLVHYNQYHYLRSHQEFGYSVVAKNEEHGSKTIAGSLVVRRDSGIATVADLKGKKIVFGGGPMAMQSYIVATYLLRRAGLQKGDYLEVFARTPPLAIKTVFYRHAVAAGTGDVAMRLDVVTKEVDVSELGFLARSEALANLPWAVTPGMKPALVRAITAALTTLTDTAHGREVLKAAKLTGLLPATDREYDPHRLVVHTVTGEKL